MYYTAYDNIANKVLSISLTLDNYKLRLYQIKP